MCRLFGLHAGSEPVSATFWLIDAPDSLSAQSHRNPDGAGIGVFEPGQPPRVDKQPMAAWQDEEFATAARELRGTTFLAHIRYASTGGLTEANTHPFLQDGRLFGHNGVVRGLDVLEERLCELEAADLVLGDTDSERVFALITAEARRNQGDLRAGIVTAVGWIAERLPVFSLNFVLATPTELWALRYPASHRLYVLERPAGGAGSPTPLDAQSDRIHAQSEPLSQQPSVIVASEPMDSDPGWRLLAPGELLRVGPDLRPESSTPFTDPAHPLSLAELDSTAAASQQPEA